MVDIPAGLVLSGDLATDGSIEVREHVPFGEMVGAIGVAENGAWIVAGVERLYVRTAEGTITPGPRILPEGSGRRLNDGKPDPAGSFVVGSLALEGRSTSEELVVVHGDIVDRIDTDLTLSNGLAWTADGRTFFSVDTERRVVFRRRWHAAGPAWGERTVFLSFDSGYPDGICLHADEHLWIAMWGLGEVRRHSPSGKLLAVFEMPAPHPSSVAFAGPDLATLVITRATKDLVPELLDRFPGSGHLFTIVPGVRGLPQTPAGPTA